MNAQKKHAHHAVQMVVVNDHRFAVEEINGNISFNLSQMAKPYGKNFKPTFWLRNNEAITYIDALTKLRKCTSADLVQVRHGGRAGEAGTWTTDYRIAVRFAQWLDVNFAIAVDELIYKILTKNARVIEPFCGVWPLVENGNVLYNYRDVLKALGESTTSGTVSRRKKRFPQMFRLHFGRNFVTPEFCRYLQKVSEVKQLELEFPNQKLQA